MIGSGERPAPPPYGCYFRSVLFGVVAIGAAVYGIYSWLNPVPPGERVSLPAYGLVADLPPGWRPTRIHEPAIESPGEQALVLTAGRAGKGECDVWLRQSIATSTLGEVAPAILDAFGDLHGLTSRPTTQAVDLASGPALEAKAYPPTGHADIYIIAGQDDRFYALWCHERYRHTDEWRGVAESIESLPETE